MPTYSYRCTECGNAFDIQQSFSDDSLTVCPVCSGKLRKIFSAVGVTFNGSGFYRTDSRAKPSEGSGSGSPKTPSTSAGSDGSSSGKASGTAAAPSKPASSGSGSGSGSSSSGSSGGGSSPSK